jgi:hypothetical protein
MNGKCNQENFHLSIASSEIIIFQVKRGVIPLQLVFISSPLCKYNWRNHQI